MSLDVHSYDTRLDTALITYINTHPLSDNSDIYSNFLQDINSIYGSCSAAHNGLQLIINNCGSNNDTINHLDAKAILNIIIQKYNSSDNDTKSTILALMIEQMADMFNTGQCSQGRTIRLYQILNCFY